MRTRLDDHTLRLTRRSLLSGSALAATAAATGACGLFDTGPKPPPAPDPLVPLLATTLALVDQYDAIMLALPQLATRLTPLADAHRTHAAELARVMAIATPSATPAPSPSRSLAADPASAVVELRTAELAAQRVATEACLAAPGGRAPLLGSITACLATHAEVLR